MLIRTRTLKLADSRPNACEQRPNRWPALLDGDSSNQGVMRLFDDNGKEENE